MKRIITKERIAEFKTYLCDEEKSAATVEKYVRDVTAFFTWTGGEKFDKSVVIAYKEYLIERYMTASVNSMLSSLNGFFAFCEWHECRIKTLKCQKQLFVKESAELTRAEYERLLEAAKNRNNMRLYYVMQTICASGIRISELCFITVEAVKRQMAQVQCKGKGRTVFLPKELCKILKEYIAERKIKSGSVFVTKSGRPLNRSNVWTEMKKLCKAAGVARSKVFPHNLRHLFARTFYSRRKDIVRLADLLGHSSVNTTRIYTMESGREHRRKIQNLGLVCLRL